MGDIIFTAKNKITETSKSTSWIAEKADAVMQAMGLVKQKGENGVDLLIGEPPPSKLQKTGVVEMAYFAKIANKQYVQIKTRDLENNVLVIVRTTGLIGKKISLNIIDREGVLVKSKYGAIPFLQEDKDVQGKFITQVNENNLAVFRINLKANNQKTTDAWIDLIDKTAGKKAFLSLLVDAQSHNPDYKIQYNGMNPSDDQESAKGEKANYWLDRKGTWFELKYCICCNMKVDKEGFFNSPKVTKNRIEKLEKYDWKEKVQYIILHRTVSSSETSSISSFKTGIGTHFLVSKTGVIYQTASLNKTTSHIRNGYNSKTVGIEVVGMPTDEKGVPTMDSKKIKKWEPVTAAQAEATACIVKGLLKHYGLSVSEVKNHEDLQAKTAGEGKTVYDAIINLLQ